MTAALHARHHAGEYKKNNKLIDYHNKLLQAHEKAYLGADKKGDTKTAKFHSAAAKFHKREKEKALKLSNAHYKKGRAYATSAGLDPNKLLDGTPKPTKKPQTGRPRGYGQSKPIVPYNTLLAESAKEGVKKYRRLAAKHVKAMNAAKSKAERAHHNYAHQYASSAASNLDSLHAAAKQGKGVAVAKKFAQDSVNVYTKHVKGGKSK